ncbi:MAG TPA: hypothetical protein VGW38_01370, partial [Chloroflexota bacterium]|nr:hypothetical protein [Chloroflexota bacterium]
GHGRGRMRAPTDESGLNTLFSGSGVLTAVQVDTRWIVECAHGVVNGHSKLRHCTQKRRLILDVFLIRRAPASLHRP